MFVVYDWPFPRMDFAKNVADIIFHLNSWLFSATMSSFMEMQYVQQPAASEEPAAVG